jgi:hypothetical protein
MTLPQSDRQISDPETLSHLHRLFQSCWQEVAAKLSSSLDSESESSLQRTIASRIMREEAKARLMSKNSGARRCSASTTRRTR